MRREHKLAQEQPKSALGQAQRVAAEREDLAALLGGGDVTQLGAIGRMFALLTDAHAQRMAALGLGD